MSLADLVNTLPMEILEEVALGEAVCECGTRAAAIGMQTYTLLCGRCRRCATEPTTDVQEIRGALMDLADAFRAALDDYVDTCRILPLGGAELPAVIGAYVLGEPCSRCVLHYSDLGLVVSMLAHRC